MHLLASVGNLQNPLLKLAPNVTAYNSTTPGYGLFLILSSLVKMVIAFAGIYVFINFILAGYQFIGAGGDPKNIAKASAKIYQSIIGLIITAGSFVIAAVIGQLLYHDPRALLTFSVFTP
jgi:hypothetical protein